VETAEQILSEHGLVGPTFELAQSLGGDRDQEGYRVVRRLLLDLADLLQVVADHAAKLREGARKLCHEDPRGSYRSRCASGRAKVSPGC